MQNGSFKHISLGVMLLVISWAGQQFFLSWAVWAGGGKLDETVLEADLDSDFYNQTEEERIDLAEERAESDGGEQDKINDINDDIQDKKADIREEAIEDTVDAEVDSVGYKSTTLSMIQWFLRLKILFDFVKIGAIFLMLKGALGLVQDNQVDSLTRWFGIGAAIIVLYALLTADFLRELHTSWYFVDNLISRGR
tara:strand:+ start:434 stop:1018 length:585 start_codon:yes stop_codon:yes gene_type:complete